MKKSLIALAVAGAVAAPAAFAASSNVDIYGIFGVSVDVYDRDNLQEDEFRVSSTASRLGFKGAEDLGGGLSAIWQAETGLEVESGGAFGSSGASGMRNTFVGLSSKSLGTVRLGRYDTAYKMSSGRYDVFADTMGDYNTIMGSLNGLNGAFDVRETNSISYETPDISGLKLMGTYGQRNEAGATATDPQLWSLAAVYANGPLSVIAAYEAHDDAAPATGVVVDADSWKLGAGYKFGNTQLAAIYERTDINSKTTGVSDANRGAWYVSARHDMGNIALKGAYGNASDSDINGVDDGADFWALGVDYALSKRTVAYALYSSLDNDRDANYTIGGNGTNGAFASGDTSAVVGNQFGGNPNGLSVGIKHSF